jgi:hypothetical protein
MFSLFFLFLISTSRHYTTNFLSLTQQQQQHFPLTHSEAAPEAAAAAEAPPPHIDVQGHSMTDVIRLLGNPVEATTFVQNFVLLLVEDVV